MLGNRLKKLEWKHCEVEKRNACEISSILPPEKEDLPSVRFPISSVVLRLHVGQHICIWR
jgi:hypothetical protein